VAKNPCIMAVATRARTAKPKESDIQRTLVGFCRAVLPPSAVIFAVPNGSRRTASGKASNAVPGLLKGVSDLIVLPAPHCVIFAEVKRPGRKPDPAQEVFASNVRPLGHHFALWTSIDDARNTFAALGIKTREAV
jgi:hypothetical protein